jgi:DNA (cytosine-5)-methyltransferase 1
MKKIYRTVDLFAGIGGVRLGFEAAGFKTVFANDFDKYCKITYDLNFNSIKLNTDDIRSVEAKTLPEYDILLAGFPCQAFSIAGYQKGFKDDKGRGNLFFEIARIMEETQPLGFMLENVKNLRGHDHGRTYSIIEKTLKQLGYSIKTEVLNSMEYGNVPQTRERIYIVGFKSEKHLDRFSFPEPRSLKKSVWDLLEKKNLEIKFYYNGKPLSEKLKDCNIEEQAVYQWRRVYVRKNKKGVCPTLTANMGTGGHNVPIIRDKNGIRKLTPRECARLQGFPDGFKLPELADAKLYMQFGNSVTVPVIKRIAQNMQKALEG